MASCIRGWRPDASGRPTNTGNISVTAFYLLAYSGFLTGADIKSDVGATPSFSPVIAERVLLSFPREAQGFDLPRLHVKLNRGTFPHRSHGDVFQ